MTREAWHGRWWWWVVVTTPVESCCVVIVIREAEAWRKYEEDGRNPLPLRSHRTRVTAPRAKGPPEPCGRWCTHRRPMSWWSTVWMRYSP